MKERLQKLIAESGFCSRRAAEKYIESGAVKVNGHKAAVGDKADKNDLISINGKKIVFTQQKRYIKLYKPRGYTTSMADAHGKKLITKLLKGINERVYPVGRLDKDSEGLILLTNDGGFANSVTHPSSKIKKKYRVTVPHIVSEEIIARLSAGVNIGEDGKNEVTAPCEINVLVSEKSRITGNEVHGAPKNSARTISRTVLEFVITEGKNRQIRRMCTAVGLEVSRLKRTSVGGIKLGMLKPGEYADLDSKELRFLSEATGNRYGENKKRTKF